MDEKGKGKRKGEAGESNEGAMWRMIEGRGKGKHAVDSTHSKGKGKGKNSSKGKAGGPPSTDELSDTRRRELRLQVEEFARSGAAKLDMPTSTTGLERKYLHEVCDDLGLTSQSFGIGHGRYLSIFRAECSAPPLVANDQSSVSKTDDDGTVTYSCVVLDQDSQARLKELCKDLFPNVSLAANHCEHMTLCMGSLANPFTVDNRSCAEALRDQIRSLAPGQVVTLRVVSYGARSDVTAVGVVGCPSCNRNPHVTLATAAGTAPVEANRISVWSPLEESKWLALTGMVWQRGPKRVDTPPVWMWPCRRDRADVTRDFGQEGAVQRVCKYLLKIPKMRPRQKDSLARLLERTNMIPRRIYTVHPGQLAMALRDDLPSEVLDLMQCSLLQPLSDPLSLFADLPVEVPADVIGRVRRDLGRILSRGGALGASCLVRWLISQAYCIGRRSSASVIDALLEDGTLTVHPDGHVEYINLHMAAQEVPYLEPWRFKAPPKGDATDSVPEGQSPSKLITDTGATASSLEFVPRAPTTSWQNYFLLGR